MSDLRALIESCPGPDDARQLILRFLDNHPDALERTCAEGHLTASAAVVDRDRGAALLVLHRKLGRWLQPGGHADGESDLAAVALREATEETGLVGLAISGGPIDLDVHEIPAHGHEPSHVHLDVRFLVLASRDAEPVLNREVVDSRWVTLADVDALDDLDDSTRRLLRAALGDQ